MPACPNPDCHKVLTELKDYVYGVKGPDSGLMGKINELGKCLAKKVPKVWVYTFVGVFALSGITGGYKLFSDVQAGELMHQQNVQTININAEHIKRLTELARANELRQVKVQSDLGHINQALCEMKQDLKKALDE